MLSNPTTNLVKTQIAKVGNVMQSTSPHCGRQKPHFFLHNCSTTVKLAIKINFIHDLQKSNHIPLNLYFIFTFLYNHKSIILTLRYNPCPNLTCYFFSVLGSMSKPRRKVKASCRCCTYSNSNKINQNMSPKYCVLKQKITQYLILTLH